MTEPQKKRIKTEPSGPTGLTGPKEFDLTIIFESFYEPFKVYVKDIDNDDFEILDKLIDDGPNSNGAWVIQEGVIGNKAKIFVDIFKKYFPIKIAIFTWVVPQCAGGIMLVFQAKKQTLDDMIDKLKLDQCYEIHDVDDDEGEDDSYEDYFI